MTEASVCQCDNVVHRRADEPRPCICAGHYHEPDGSVVKANVPRPPDFADRRRMALDSNYPSDFEWGRILFLLGGQDNEARTVENLRAIIEWYRSQNRTSAQPKCPSCPTYFDSPKTSTSTP